MIPLSQTHAKKLVESIWRELKKVDALSLSRALEVRSPDAYRAVESVLAPLFQLVAENLDELAFLQRMLLTQREWDEHQDIIGLHSEEIAEGGRELKWPWAVLRRERKQPLVGYLLLLIGDGWTDGVEIQALTEDFCEVLCSIEARLAKLPPDVGPIKSPDGAVYMSVALATIWPQARQMRPRTRILLNKMREHGPCTHKKLALRSEDATVDGSVQAVYNALTVPKKLHLISACGEHKGSVLWQLSGLGSEFLAFDGDV